eukprot:1148588-Pelagomonas_calceolata.AAC.1
MNVRSCQHKCARLKAHSLSWHTSKWLWHEPVSPTNECVPESTQSLPAPAAGCGRTQHPRSRRSPSSPAEAPGRPVCKRDAASSLKCDAASSLKLTQHPHSSVMQHSSSSVTQHSSSSVMQHPHICHTHYIATFAAFTTSATLACHHKCHIHNIATDATFTTSPLTPHSPHCH